MQAALQEGNIIGYKNCVTAHMLSFEKWEGINTGQEKEMTTNQLDSHDGQKVGFHIVSISS